MNGCNQWYLWLKWMIVNVNIQPIDFIEWRYIEMDNHCKEMLMDSIMYQCSLYQMNWYEWMELYEYSWFYPMYRFLQQSLFMNCWLWEWNYRFILIFPWIP